MGKYFAPLWIFLGGMVLMLFSFLLFQAIGTAGDQLAADSVAYKDVFWNWDLVSGDFVKFLVLLIEFAGVMFLVFKAFLRVK